MSTDLKIFLNALKTKDIYSKANFYELEKIYKQLGGKEDLDILLDKYYNVETFEYCISDILFAISLEKNQQKINELNDIVEYIKENRNLYELTELGCYYDESLTIDYLLNNYKKCNYLLTKNHK